MEGLSAVLLSWVVARALAGSAMDGGTREKKIGWPKKFPSSHEM
jgi:hypothetical protein